MSFKKNLILMFLFIVICFGFSTVSNAGYQEWNSLNYDVRLNSDGSMTVTENWDVYISETNTLFKDFDVSNLYTKILDDVNVVQVIEGVDVPLERIYEEQYHVDSGCYYGLMTKPNVFEIAWNVGLDNSSDTRNYKISYTVPNVVTKYNDCTELYWQFLSSDNGMSGKNITGIITLPSPVSNLENLRVWAHGQLDGEITKASNDTVTFALARLNSNSMLEIRIVTDEDIFTNLFNVSPTNKLSSILEEEQRWADEANEIRKRNQMVIAGILIGEFLLLALLVIKYIRYISEGKEIEIKYTYPDLNIEYFRDIPNEKEATPARASYMYNFKGTSSTISESKVFSATILNLALKRIIEFEPIDKKNVRIKFLFTPEADKSIDELKSDEKLIYDLLIMSAKGSDSITTKDLSRIASKNYESWHSRFAKLESVVKLSVQTPEIISKERKDVYKKWNLRATIYIMLVIIGFFCLPMVVPFSFAKEMFMVGAVDFVMLILCMIKCIRNSKKIDIFTEKGYEEKAQWKGLKQYMKDFSLLKEKEVPDLILWEKYLVYATVFGISKKVIEQLKVVYPEMMDESNYDSRYTYMRCMCYNPSGRNKFYRCNR